MSTVPIDAVAPFRRLRLATALAGAVATGGCAPHYLERSDTISPQAGQALRANVAAHAVNPFPVSADDPRFLTPAGRLPKTTTRDTSETQAPIVKPTLLTR